MTTELPSCRSKPGIPATRESISTGKSTGSPTPPGRQLRPLGSVQNGSQMLSALVWSGYEIPDRPTWLRDVQPILAQYANLYPVMKPIVDLGNYSSVVSRRAILRNVFTSPMTDPNYMPVTRDLSAAKRAMLCRWLEHPLYMDLSSPPGSEDRTPDRDRTRACHDSAVLVCARTASSLAPIPKSPR